MDSLDLFIATLRDLAEAAKRGDVERFKQAPRLAPRRRLDETTAAREPKLRWQPDAARQRGSGVGLGRPGRDLKKMPLLRSRKPRSFPGTPGLGRLRRVCSEAIPARGIIRVGKTSTVPLVCALMSSTGPLTPP